MATYTQAGEDLLPDYKPYTPDFSFIDKMLKRKEAQYEQGFAQLSNQYNLINKDLTNPTNIKYRDEFLKAAKNNLKDLSAMDLSEFQNVNEATSIFKPFYSNTQAIQDQVLTDFWNKQEATAESYRLREGGKEFSPDNLRYIQMQRAAFAADDPSTVGKYAAQRRYYTPYYDYNKEIKEAMKDFKPSHTLIQDIKGMYRVTVEDQSWNKLEIAQYLNTVLSDKAKQQMRIEAAVRLGGDDNFLLNQYMQNEAPKIESLTKLIDEYNGKIKVEKDPNKVIEFKKNIEYYDNQRAEISNNLKSLRGGDMSFLKENAENLAYNAYYTTMVDKFSGGFSHKDISQKIDGDEVAMMYYTQAAQDRRQQESLNAEWARMVYGKQYDWAKMLYENDRQDQRDRLKIMAESGGPGIPVGGLTPEIVNNSSEALGDKYYDANVGRKNAYIALSEHILEMSGGRFTDLKQLDTKEGRAYVNNFIRSNSADATVQEFLQAGTAFTNAKAAIINHTTTFYTNLRQTLGTDKYNILRTYEKALAKNGGNEAAAIAATGKDAAVIASLLETRDVARSKYESDSRNIVGVSPNGIMVSKDSKVYKNTMGYISNVISETDAGGLRFYPNTGGGTFNIAVSIKPDLAAVLDAGGDKKAKLMNEYKSIFKSDVIWDSQYHQLVFKGLGSHLAPQLDPLYGVPGFEKSALSSIMNVQLAPGEVSAAFETMMYDGGIDKKGTDAKKRHIQIYKKNDVIYTKIDNIIWQPSTGNWGDVTLARNGVMKMLSENTSTDIDNELNK